MSSKVKIVVVEDNDDLRNLLVRHVKKHDYLVMGADCADELDDLLVENTFDIVVLDLNLPGEDGLSLAKRLKISNPDIYIIMATARNNANARIVGYESGADIYLTKPFSSDELLAVIRSAERRLSSQFKEFSLELNLIQMMLVGKATVDLNKKEIAILKSLAEAEGFKLPFFRLIEVSGDEVTDVGRATLDVRITRLKKKFVEAGYEMPAIKVNRAEGYQLLVNLKLIAKI